jgi:hypothetical protein
MSAAFANLKIYSPPDMDLDGKKCSPIDYMDTADADNRKVIKIDWVPEELKAIVQDHKPEIGDVNDLGEFNKTKLTAAATKLFTMAQKTICFVNLYQLKQFASQFADYWGFHLTTDSMTLKCFYQRRIQKVVPSTISPTKQRKCSSVKGECGFVVRAVTCDKGLPKHRQRVRISGFMCC